MTQDNSNGGRKDKGVLRADQNELLGKGFSFSGYERDPLYLNLGTKKFTDISGVSGIDSITDGRAGVFADFDNDGDPDVFMTTIQNQSHLLFRNNVGQDHNFIRVALEGGDCGRDAFGAVVRVKTSAGLLTKIKAGGSGFMSQHDPRLLFGLGKDAKAEWLEVTWPDGKTQRFENVAAGVSLRVTEGKAQIAIVKETKSKLPEPLSREARLLATLKLRKGEPFPALTVTKPDGSAVPLASLIPKGHRALVNVWATWCLPCAKEMPELERLYPQFSASKIRLIGLSIDTEGIGVVKDYLSKRSFTYPMVNVGEQGIGQLFATDEATVPLSVLLDEKGRVVKVFGGWSKQTAEELEALAKQR